MAISDILASIDCDIAQLQQARALLSGGAAPAPKKAAAKQEGSRRPEEGSRQTKEGCGGGTRSHDARQEEEKPLA
jgi:hypothetical protein